MDAFMDAFTDADIVDNKNLLPVFRQKIFLIGIRYQQLKLRRFQAFQVIYYFNLAFHL